MAAFDFNFTNHDFFEFLKEILGQFFGSAGNQAAAELGYLPPVSAFAL